MTDELTTLALAAGRGDRAALSEFIRASQADLWRFLARAVGADAAEDLAQETYLRVLGALPGFEDGRAPAPGCSRSPATWWSTWFGARSRDPG